MFTNKKFEKQLKRSVVITSNSVFTSLPTDNNKGQNSELYILGKKIFYADIQVGDINLSCINCHKGKNTIYNSKYKHLFMSDGRYLSLKSVLISKRGHIAKLSNNLDKYITKINHLLNKTITLSMLSDALITYLEYTLTSQTKFDDYLRGNHNALKENEVQGMKLIKQKGCVYCHSGVLLGGNIRTNNPSVNRLKKMGYYNFTKINFDKYKLRVTSLREAYYIDLKQHIPSRSIAKDEIDKINAFLKVLSMNRGFDEK